MFGPPRPLDDGDLLYIAPLPVHRKIMLSLLVIVALLAVVVLVGALILAVMAARDTVVAGIVIGAVFAAFPLLLMAVAGACALWAGSVVFAVTTKGLTLTPPYRRTRFIPWSEVAGLEACRGVWMSGALLVTTRDGTRLIATVTNPASAYAQAPAPPHLGPDTGATVPMQVALDALERHRRGEFGGDGVTAPHPPGASSADGARPPAG